MKPTQNRLARIAAGIQQQRQKQSGKGLQIVRGEELAAYYGERGSRPGNVTEIWLYERGDGTAPQVIKRLCGVSADDLIEKPVELCADSMARQSCRAIESAPRTSLEWHRVLQPFWDAREEADRAFRTVVEPPVALGLSRVPFEVITLDTSEGEITAERAMRKSGSQIAPHDTNVGFGPRGKD